MKLNTIIQGHVLDVLRTLPAESVQCCVTSPPYLGLRVYGTPPVLWGPSTQRRGDAENDEAWRLCEHEWEAVAARGVHYDSGSPSSTLAGGCRFRAVLLGTNRNFIGEGGRGSNNPAITGESAFCVRCGSWRGHLGLEPTIALYVEHMVSIFAEVWRVLRPDGTLWLNLGDSYAGSNCGSNDYRSSGASISKNDAKYRGQKPGISPGLKPKDLVGMPWTVALALRAWGWHLRRDICWHKLNPMPESTDTRPTSAHEYIFLLTKNAGNALYWTHRDLPGVRKQPEADYRYLHATGREQVEEPPNWKTSIITCPVCNGTGKAPVYEEAAGLIPERLFLGYAKCACWKDEEEEAPGDADQEEDGHEAQRKPKRGQVWEWRRINLWAGHDYFYDAEAVREEPTESTKRRVRLASTRQGEAEIKAPVPDGYKRCETARVSRDMYADNRDHLVCAPPAAGRNCRSVWTFATEPYLGAHFATFPKDLPRRCILAGTSAQACPKCGAPWKRVVDTHFVQEGVTRNRGTLKGGYGELMAASMTRGDKGHIGHNENTTLGFRPTCQCIDPPVGRCIVLDPFAGVGTTGVVALELGRDFIGCDLAGGDKDYGKGPGGVKHHTANQRLAAAEAGLSLAEYLGGQGTLVGKGEGSE